MKTPQKKDFDCIRLKNEAQARISKHISNLTAEQEIAYFHKAAGSGTLAEWWKKVKSGRNVSIPEQESVE